MLLPLDVIWIIDECIKPPGPKMVVCIDPEFGLFFRINTEPKWQTPVALAKSSNEWLQHDSYLECGEPLELDDYIIETSVASKGVIGAVAATAIIEIIKAIEKSVTLSERDKARIRSGLGVS